MFAVVGAIDAELIQQVQQHGAEVAVKLADGSFEVGIRLQRVHVLGHKLLPTPTTTPQPQNTNTP